MIAIPVVSPPANIQRASGAFEFAASIKFCESFQERLFHGPKAFAICHFPFVIEEARQFHDKWKIANGKCSLFAFYRASSNALAS
jgi:hypothetical protein